MLLGGEVEIVFNLRTVQRDVASVNNEIGFLARNIVDNGVEVGDEVVLLAA